MRLLVSPAIVSVLLTVLVGLSIPAATHALPKCGTMGVVTSTGTRLLLNTLQVATGGFNTFELPINATTWMFVPARDQLLVFGPTSATFINISNGVSIVYDSWSSPQTFEGQPTVMRFVGYDSRKAVVYAYFPTEGGQTLYASNEAEQRWAPITNTTLDGVISLSLSADGNVVTAINEIDGNVEVRFYNCTTGLWSSIFAPALKYPLLEPISAQSRLNNDPVVWLSMNDDHSVAQSLAIDTCKLGPAKSIGNLAPTQAVTDAAYVASSSQVLIPVCNNAAGSGPLTLSLFDANALSVAYKWEVASSTSFPWDSCDYAWSPKGCV